MDAKSPRSSAQFNQLLTEAVQYGQQLRVLPLMRMAVIRNFTDDIFSLVAYPDQSGLCMAITPMPRVRWLWLRVEFGYSWYVS